jgi:large subunit ribosomal protein L30
MSDKKIKVTLVKSVIGTKAVSSCDRARSRAARINHTVELQDTPEVRGMINKVSYLVKCEG